MTKTVAVLGSTGSIGRQTLQVVQELGLTVAALTANRQVDLLEQQARQLHPKLAVLYDRAAAGELRLRLSDTDIRVAEGPEGLLEAATLPEADTVVTAVMGSVGLEPTLAAIREINRQFNISESENLQVRAKKDIAAALEWRFALDSNLVGIFKEKGYKLEKSQTVAGRWILSSDGEMCGTITQDQIDACKKAYKEGVSVRVNGKSSCCSRN